MNYRNILIADDHNLIMDGFEQRLKLWDSEVRIFKAKNKPMLMEILAQERIDVLFQDVIFGQYDAREFVAEIKNKYPDLSIVIMSTLTDATTVNALLKQGASGYISKVDDSSELIRALDAISKGDLFLSPDIQNRRLRASAEKSVFITAREERVLRLIVEGKTSKEIAETLNISVKTVETHRSNLFAKFGARNVVELVKRAIFEGYS